ncbi:TetR/AcrR family transcriptional regulator [Streptomyces sp. NBC_00370]|uniref:TetR/AcrR family transcriptional regulator n=1 Tax=Streptomyces sp. NBC_00370 TaxID=2975728 RepID=UPI002E2530BF
MRPDTSAAATRSRVRNRRGQGDRLRDEIVTAAVDLLDEAGDAGAVTLRSVARRVGIAAPSIYRHFPDQPAIMLAVVRNAFAELDEQLGAADTAAGTSAQAAADTATGTAVEAAADTAANPAEHSAANPAEDSAGDAPRERLTALCHSYLAFARAHPGRYRAMFGGLWTPDLDASSVTEEDVATLGQASMRRLAEALGGCVAAGRATSTDLAADAVALWLGLHGLAHQQAVAPSFRWPPDIAERVITALAHFTDVRPPA